MGLVKTAACSARADVVIGPYRILRACIGTYGFVTSYRAGGVEPLPYGMDDGFYEFAGVCANLRLHPAREGQAPPLRYDEGIGAAGAAYSFSMEPSVAMEM